MDERKLAEAVQAPTDYSGLVSALTSEEALATIRSRDPLAGARLRGIEAKRKLRPARRLSVCLRRRILLVGDSA